MMPAIPPNVAPDELPKFLCRKCVGTDPVEVEPLED